jgi:hypothetical protein
VSTKVEEPKVHGPFPLWTIVIRRLKDPESARKSMAPDPKKPTVQAPEMIMQTEVYILPQKPDGTLLTEKEVEQIFRRFVQKNRHRYSESHSYSLKQRIVFWTVEDAPEINLSPCPAHPDQRENFCGRCGHRIFLGLKTTP